MSGNVSISKILRKQVWVPKKVTFEATVTQCQRAHLRQSVLTSKIFHSLVTNI